MIVPVPKYDEQEAMRNAWLTARMSPDPSTQLGAILLLQRGQGVDYTYGCNRIPPHAPKHILQDREKKYAQVIHAEVDAIARAARLGFITMNSAMVCPWACCTHCASVIIAAGVSRLVFDNACLERCPDRWRASVTLGQEMLRREGVEVRGIDLALQKPETLFNGEKW